MRRCVAASEENLAAVGKLGCPTAGHLRRRHRDRDCQARRQLEAAANKPPTRGNGGGDHASFFYLFFLLLFSFLLTLFAAYYGLTVAWVSFSRVR